MQTWALWTFGVIALTTVMRLVLLGFSDYPRVIWRGTDAADVVLAVAWLVWGACAIW